MYLPLQNLGLQNGTIFHKSDGHPSLTLALRFHFATKENTKCLENLVSHQLPSEKKILIRLYFMT